MDPSECLAWLLVALAEDELEAARDAADDLHRWMVEGGSANAISREALARAVAALEAR